MPTSARQRLQGSGPSASRWQRESLPIECIGIHRFAVALAVGSALEHDDGDRRRLAMRKRYECLRNAELRCALLRAPVQGEIRRAIVAQADLDLAPANRTREMV